MGALDPVSAEIWQNCLVRDQQHCIVSREFATAAAAKGSAKNTGSCAKHDGNLLKHRSNDQFQYWEVCPLSPSLSADAGFRRDRFCISHYRDIRSVLMLSLEHSNRNTLWISVLFLVRCIKTSSHGRSAISLGGFSMSTAPLRLSWNLSALSNILRRESWMPTKMDRHT